MKKLKYLLIGALLLLVACKAEGQLKLNPNIDFHNFAAPTPDESLRIAVSDEGRKGFIYAGGYWYSFTIKNNRVKAKYPYEIQLDHSRHVISIYNYKTKLMTRIKVISKPFKLTNTISN